MAKMSGENWSRWTGNMLSLLTFRFNSIKVDVKNVDTQLETITSMLTLADGEVTAELQTLIPNEEETV